MTIVEQNAGRSDGERLEIKLPSTTTSSSMTWAPALRRSVRILGYEVSVRPTATPASTSVQGPWQIAAIGFPEHTKSRTNETAEQSSRSLSGFTVPPGSTKPSNSSTDASDTARSTAKTRPARDRGYGPGFRPPSATAVRPEHRLLPTPHAVGRALLFPHHRPRGWQPSCPAVHLTSAVLPSRIQDKYPCGKRPNIAARVTPG